MSKEIGGRAGKNTGRGFAPLEKPSNGIAPARVSAELSCQVCRPDPYGFCFVKGVDLTLVPSLIDIREPLLKRMREKLVSEEGRLKYFMRQYIIEPIFGHLKFNVGYRNFLLRGLEKVRAEFKLMCIGWNLKKMLKMGIKPVKI